MYALKKQQVQSSLVPMSTIDPTKTLTYRNLFVHQFNARFRHLRLLINKSIISNDCFGILNGRSYASAQISDLPTFASYKTDTFPLSHNQFEFSTNQGKLDGFMDWLRLQETYTIFQPQAAFNITGIRQARWYDAFISGAYKKGMLWARYNIRKDKGLLKSLGLTKDQVPVDDAFISEAFSSSVHADKVSMLYSRAFSDLNGITTQMDAAISRALSDGLILGLSPQQIAKNIVDRLEKIGRHRAIVLARTEIIRAHHIAAIQTYRDFGVQGVAVKAEWKTAGDSRVCALCQPLEGRIFTLDQIEGKIPLHPQCRCAALPIVVN